MNLKIGLKSLINNSSAGQISCFINKQTIKRFVSIMTISNKIKALKNNKNSIINVVRLENY